MLKFIPQYHKHTVISVDAIELKEYETDYVFIVKGDLGINFKSGTYSKDLYGNIIVARYPMTIDITKIYKKMLCAIKKNKIFEFPNIF